MIEHRKSTLKHPTSESGSVPEEALRLTLTYQENKDREKSRRKTETYNEAHREAVKRYKLQRKSC
jgi:hypothetical protein